VDDRNTFVRDLYRPKYNTLMGGFKMKTSCNKRSIYTAIVIPVSLLFLIISTFYPGTAFAAPAADPQASPKTQAVLDYITNLPNRSDNRVISGQHTFMTDNLIEKILSDDGKYVGLVGVDYFYENNASTNNQLITWSNANSLITVCHHWNNPVTGSINSPSYGSGSGTAWDTTSVDFTQLITNGTALNTKFNGYLDAVAAGFQTLENAGVTVLYRPFHEMNGNWFWWGGKNSTQFKNVWIYVFNYLTQTKGLHNLLWVYAPNATLDWTYYPGSQYVDIVGVDIYSALNVPKVSGYDQLSTYNKPFGLTEWGACGPAGGCSPMDISPMIASIKANMPKTAFFMAWAQNFSLDYNLGTTKLFADPWIITRDDISLAGTGTGPSAPSAPIGLQIVSVQ
jgi:mannan endo-1,4-beta-mannosidase